MPQDDKFDAQIESTHNMIYGAPQTVYGDQTVYIQTPPPFAQPPSTQLEVKRNNFLYDFLKQALGQAETTFRLSVIFMSAGAVILLVGGCMALANAGNPNWNLLPVLTSLSGLLITACGGAFAVHSNRARKHLTEQADRLHEEMRSDVLHTQTLELIDRVTDENLRDRLRSVTAMRLLGLNPDSAIAMNKILPNQTQDSGELESGQ